MKRQSGIDLIRITGLFFVVGLHQFLYNGFYYLPQKGLLIWSADVMRWLFFCCNGLFMMLTGYLRSSKTEFSDCYRGLIPILLGYFFCTFIVYPVQHFTGEELPVFSFTEMSWFQKLITFGNYAWYIEMYIGLILFSPVINLGIGQMGDRMLAIFAGIMIFATSAHGMTALD